MPQRCASTAIASRAARLLPTNSSVPPSATSLRTNSVARLYSGSVFSRLMMWILLRSPKMNCDIFGFQKRVWCPKCTPASSIRRIDTSAMELSFRVSPPRSPADDPVARAPGQWFDGACVVLNLEAFVASEARALYHSGLAATTPIRAAGVDFSPPGPPFAVRSFRWLGTPKHDGHDQDA